MSKKHHRRPRPVAEPAPSRSPVDTDASNPKRTRYRALSLALIFGWALMVRAPVASIPLDRDEGEYAYIAQRALVGEVPYQKSFDQKPPGTFFVYALIERWIGTSPAAIHWATQAYELGTLALVFFLGEKLFSIAAGAFAALLLALMMTDTTVTGNSSNTELFMILPLTASLLTTLLAEARASIAWALATGVLLAASCLFKQVALANGVFIFLYLAIKSRTRLSLALGVAAGMALIFSTVIGYFLAEGAWKAFYDSVLGFNFNYASLVPWADYPMLFWVNFKPQLQAFAPVYLLVALALVSALRQPSSFRLLFAWLLASFVGVAIGGYFRGHYFIQILPVVTLLASGFLVTETLRRWPGRAILISALGIALIAGFAMGKNFWYYGPETPEAKARKIYGKNPFVESLAVGRYLADHSAPSDSVFIFGSEPQLLYYANRPSASRYMFIYPVMAPSSDHSPDRQQQVLMDLLDHRPKFIVTVFVPASFGISGSYYPIFETLQHLLEKSYAVAAIMPTEATGSLPLVEGPAAQAMWTQNPYWYNGNAWCALAIWQRKN